MVSAKIIISTKIKSNKLKLIEFFDKAQTNPNRNCCNPNQWYQYTETQIFCKGELQVCFFHIHQGESPLLSFLNYNHK